MAVFTSSALTLRKKMIIAALREAGATDPASAKALPETNLENPAMFQEYTEQLVALNIIRKTPDGKYFLE